MEEATSDIRGSLATPFIFTLVLAFHFTAHWFEHSKKNVVQVKLRGEIKKLLREASTLSQISTFAQASKLRRQAAGREKELAKSFHIHCAGFMVLEDSCSFHISATSATIW